MPTLFMHFHSQRRHLVHVVTTTTTLFLKFKSKQISQQDLVPCRVTGCWLYARTYCTGKTVFACYQRSRVITKKWNHKGVKIVKNTGNVQGTRTQNSNLQNYEFTFLAKIIKIRFFFFRFLFSVQKKCLCLGHVKNWFSPKCSFCIKVCGTGMTCL